MSQTQAGATPPRLIKAFDREMSDSLTDLLMIAARDIEDAMVQSGAVPGKDYTYLELYKLAVQIHSAVIQIHGIPP
jgi:hypothetical protein